MVGCVRFNVPLDTFYVMSMMSSNQTSKGWPYIGTLEEFLRNTLQNLNIIFISLKLSRLHYSMLSLLGVVSYLPTLLAWSILS